jgi:hypothetical protein
VSSRLHERPTSPVSRSRFPHPKRWAEHAGAGCRSADCRHVGEGKHRKRQAGAAGHADAASASASGEGTNGRSGPCFGAKKRKRPINPGSAARVLPLFTAAAAGGLGLGLGLAFSVAAGSLPGQAGSRATQGRQIYPAGGSGSGAAGRPTSPPSPPPG